MQITVQGEQRVRVAPERAELHLSVTQQGTDRARVVADVTENANGLSRDLDALTASGAVERFAVEPLRTYAWKKNPASAERITATVDARVTFADFEALGRFTADLGNRGGVQLGWVGWSLTDATADRLRDECIAGAVGRARDRAASMARAAGAGALEIVEIADPGMLAVGEARTMLGGRDMVAMSARGMKMAEPEAVEIRPEEIEVGAQLQVRFVTAD
jgi:uncharacterized protein YggE